MCECGVHLITPSYIYTHTYTLFGVRNSRICAFVFPCSQHIQTCPLMCLHGGACATSWIRVLCACSTIARKRDAVLCVFIARVQMCVVNLCCCNVSVAKYMVHLVLPLETSIGHLLVERATDSASVICDWLRLLSV